MHEKTVFILLVTVWLIRRSVNRYPILWYLAVSQLIRPQS